MTKTFEEDKRFLETKKKQYIRFQRTPNVQTAYLKTEKIQKTGIASQQNIARKNTT